MTDTATGDVITPDDVTHPEAPGTELVPAEHQPTALEAAAQAALDAPGAMDHREFWALAAQARVIAMSGGAPKAIREDPHLALHVAMVGRDLGISPSAAIELIDVILGRNGEKRLSLSPQLMNGQLRRLGLGCILPAVKTNTECTAVAFGPSGPDRRCTRTGLVVHVEDCNCDVLGASEFTWEDARIAGLVAHGCQPGDHTQKCRNPQTQSNQRCNNGYVTYPKRMLWWRASGFAGDDYFPEAGLGLYSPEALGASVGADGRPIDVESVELPPGYEQAALPANTKGGKQQAEPAVQRADADELWQLQELLHALPDGVKATLRERWNGEQSNVRGYKPHDMPAPKLRAAKALVNAHWGEARQAGVDQAEEVAQLRKGLAVQLYLLLGQWFAPGQPATAAEASPAAPEQPAAPDTADQAAETPQDEPEPTGEHVDAFGKDWGVDLRFMAAEAQAVAAQLPPEIGEAIKDEVAKLHHSRVNAAIAAEELTDAYPPESPIDLRRLVVFVTKANQFISTGEKPASDDG